MPDAEADDDSLSLLVDGVPRPLDAPPGGGGGGEGGSGDAAHALDAPSVLDCYGEELTAMLTPVTICMGITVVLVRFLAGSTGGAGPSMGTLYYTEEAGDSTSRRVGGALENALAYVAIVAAITVVIFLLFKYNCTRLIWGYLGLSGVSIFLFMGGALFARLLQELAIPLDGVTFCLGLWNFGVVGVLGTFWLPLPLRLKQGYLVFIGAVTALWFTHLPELTTWALLVMMALYDIVAVLAPGGPLRALVELAQEREEDLPALVYESRPMRRARLGRPGDASGDAAGAAGADASEPPLLQEIALAELPPLRARSPRPHGMPRSDQAAPGVAAAELHEPLAPPSPPRSSGGGGSDEDRSVKLGLGDFIFYSLLVGRAAKTDVLTSCACYLGIVAGLAATLATLAVVHHALPALPISIALGVLMYVLARWVLEPFVMTLSTSLVFF